MTANPNTPQQETAPGSPEATSPAGYVALSGPGLWLHRLTSLAFVCVCAGLGVLLLILPWTSNWTDNHFLLAYPALREIVTNEFVRGMCSGLGLLDIWIGFSEALHYKEDHRT